jgi:preprotein translocase subunit SecE
MQRARRRALIVGLFSVVLAVFVLSSILFLAQGGFGRGHGRFDQAIGLLGLPWVLIWFVIPWPSSIESSDYFMLVLLPLVLNLAVVLALWTLLERRR